MEVILNGVILSAALAATLTLAAGPAQAGTLTATGTGPLPSELTAVNPRFGCTHRFTGTFEAGDADRIIAEAPSLLCLDSPGGSLVEALKLTAWMKENALATKVERDATCESACALVFMAGSDWPVEGRGAYFWRVLEPGGRLGFHAPGLFVQDGNYSKESVEKAYGIAMTSVSQMIGDLAQREDLTGVAMKLSLMRDMFATPTDSMMYVDTVDQAGRWGITVGPLIAGPIPVAEELPRICSSAQAWANDLSAEKDWLGFFGKHDDQSRQDYLVGRVTLNEISGDGCLFNVDYTRPSAPVSIHMTYEGSAAWREIQRHDPGAQLADLPYDPTSADQGICIVKRGDTETDRDPCRETRKRVGDKIVRSYAWPSGATTVIEMRADQYFYINDVQTFANVFDRQTCWLNSRTGNTFCFSRP